MEKRPPYPRSASYGKDTNLPRERPAGQKPVRPTGAVSKVKRAIPTLKAGLSRLRGGR